MGTIYLEAECVKLPMTDGTNPPRLILQGQPPPVFTMLTGPMAGRTPIPDACNKSRPAEADASGAFPLK